MNLYVYDKNFNIIDLLDDYHSIIWTKRYNKCGDFEIYLPLNKKNIKATNDEYFIVRDKDIKRINNSEIFEKVMIIERKEVIENRLGNNIIVSGRNLKSILEKRIIYPTITINDNIENVCEILLNDCIINPTNIKRKINNFLIEKTNNFDDIIIDTQVTGDNLLNYIVDLVNNYELGFDVKLVDFNFVFYLYKGKNLTYEQDEYNRVIFSNKYDNIIKFNYVYDRTNYKNFGIAVGEGENSDRKTTEVGDIDISGIDRREYFIDAKDIQSKNSQGEVIPEETYIKQLKERGEEKLKENIITTTCDREVEPNTNFIIYKDYNLGDIDEVDSENNEMITPRIVEIIESENEAGLKTILTFQTEK